MNINTVFNVRNERYDYSEEYMGTCGDSELADWIARQVENLPVVTISSEEYESGFYIHNHLSIKDNPRYILVVTKEITDDKITV
ncbi:hypothetical protein VOWphi5012_049 [Vibrio phage phi50-12]|uniref:Uncharacterized protein n=1 Tax=Vibrio phage phi50-12 TaxID=2654972 RepID=A0A5P8PRC9_9CAUD|nr:hypothetical protein KNU82_gp049 [Vibrio phage phi50-12]QFR59833.1 hypothetical protein VOWphi5012_049 [Vibrio phage phi50-12]